MAYDITTKDGITLRNIPDDIPPDSQVIRDRVAKIRAGNVDTPSPPKEDKSILDTALSGAGNALAGVVRGAGSIGATILSPYDIATDLVNGKGLTLESNRRRRAEMDSALKMMGADQESISYKGGKLVGEVAGTAGAGGVLANGMRAIPAVANAAPKLISAVESGGMALGSPASTTLAGKAGDLALRTIGGATAGGASAGMVDPEQAKMGAMISGAIPGGVKVAAGMGNILGTVAKKGIGALTGVGDEAVNAALSAGKNGSKTFLDNMRGNVPITDVLDDAKSALANMREARSAAYRQDMAALAKDKSVLDMSPIQQELSKLQSIGSYKGQVINKNASGTVDELAQQIDDWAKLDPAEFHTPEGLDALKRAIGDIRDATQFGTPARKAADQIYNAVKGQITKQAPEYAKTMKSYSEASELITEIEKSLSLGNKASADTSMRKLQSLMRNNVQTNYGNRLNLANELEQQGAEIIPAVAGQAMNSATPRGLARLGSISAGVGALSNPIYAAALPFSSPRLMGEMLYKMGQASGGVQNAMQAASPIAQKLAAILGRKEPYGALMASAPAVAFSR